MRKIINFLFSNQFTIILLVLFAAGLGVATFIEEKYDTVTARLLVYDSHWLELILLLMVVNFTGNINRYRMLSGKKFAMLLFHLAFILMILGAGLTRYLGFEGNMHIREGEAANFMYSSNACLQVVATEGNNTWKLEKPLIISEFLPKRQHFRVRTDGKGPVDIRVKDYYNNAVEKLVEHVPGGVDMVELVYATGHNQYPILLTKGETGKAGLLSIAFDKPSDSNAVQVVVQEGKILVISPYEMFRLNMSATACDTLDKYTAAEVDGSSFFEVQGISFMVKKLHESAEKQLARGAEGETGPSALTVEVTYDGKSKEVTLQGGPGYTPVYREIGLSGMKIQLAYGDKKLALPFSLFLDDFILERYAGSDSPSSYASQVTLVDDRNNIKKSHRIYMNNVLDYKGYRFFQSSYDADEKGTILSVNHDYWGTLVTYISYFLLGLGFILTLFNRNSHFRKLNTRIRELREKRKTGMVVLILLFLGFGNAVWSQQTVKNPVSADHAEKFGQLLVQTYDGRTEPLHTLAYDLMHKISRKDHFQIPGKGNMTALQVMMDMLIDGEFWKNQKIIYIQEKSVRDILGVQEKHASILDFYDQQSKYKLAQFAELSFRKKPSEQNAFDKEIIKLDERINIFISLLNGSLLKLFPVQGDPGHAWLHPGDSLANAPLQGDIAVLKNELQVDKMTYSELLRAYFMQVIEATGSGNYAGAEKILGVIGTAQRQYAAPEMLPTVKKVKLEAFYNNAEIFIKLRNWYGMLSVILLFLAFLDIIRKERSKMLDTIFNILTVILGVAFLYHTFGMGLRWVLSGHAPWSNGYEALLLMAWGSLLAGFAFVRYSRITLAATVLLAAAMLMTASHSSYDPQLTNLQPVLKSYWLIIHVAVITISYGFLGLGFVLGLINLFVSVFKNRRNRVNLSHITQELIYINEMTLTAGLFLATMGTFLGGIWANESWGRYWGWDAKETWALIIIITYAIILHFRLIPRLKSAYAFNVGSVIGFASVLMTFIGVNYYLSKGLHSYAAGETPVFPLGAWIMILAVVVLIVVAGIKEKANKVELPEVPQQQPENLPEETMT